MNYFKFSQKQLIGVVGIGVVSWAAGIIHGGWKGLGLGVISLALAGCDGHSQASVGARVLVPDGATEEVSRALTVYTWGEYVSQAVLDAFAEETGIEVDYVTFGSTEEMLAEMESNPKRYDVIILESIDVVGVAEQGFIQPLDFGLLPNFAGVGDGFKGLREGAELKYSIPYLWGTTVVAYREAVTGPSTDSWAMVFSPEGKYPVAVLDDLADTWGAALHFLGEAKGPWSIAGLKRAEKLLLGLAESSDVRFTDDLGAVEAMEAGLVGAAIVYSGDAAMLAEEDDGIDYFIPEEGAQVWTDDAVISQGCEDRSGAHQFLNFLMRPDIAAMTAEEIYYATPVTAAMESIDPELLADGRIYPPQEVLERCEELPEMSHEQRALMSTSTGRMKRLVENRLAVEAR